jgi:hypothetical protein
MRLGAIDRITPSTPIDQLPVRLDMAGSRGSFYIALIMAVPVAVVLITPFALLGSLAAVEPQAFLSANVSWVAALQLCVAFAMALALAAFAIRRVTMAWGHAATVEVGYGVVAVAERRFGFNRRWTAPVSEFLGLAHNVRASLSGSRHELVLVHPDPARNVLLYIAPSIPQPHIDRVAILLGVLEIPSRTLVRQSAPRTLPVPTPVPALPAPVAEPARAKLKLVA